MGCCWEPQWAWDLRLSKVQVMRLRLFWQVMVMLEPRLPRQCSGACSLRSVMVSGVAFSVQFSFGRVDLVVSVFIIVPPGIPISVVTIILGVIGIIVLAWLYRRALHQRMYQLPPANL